jgi:2'-5' RNA ligase
MEAESFADPRELARFRSIRRLHNHWSRPAVRQSYYWYLTFEQCRELQALAAECQRAISFPYYDLTPLSDLHLTLDRICYARETTLAQLGDIESAAIRACAEIKQFNISVGSLGGTPGAIGFTAYPAQRITELHGKLRTATLAVLPNAPVSRSEFHPHVTIAYANSDDIPATEVIAAVEKLSARAHVAVTITEVALVLLERRPRSYVWQVVSRIPLAR